MQALEAALLETAAAWEQEGRASGEVREIIGAVDETFLERMMLVFMNLTTGFLLLEEVAEDRTYATKPRRSWPDSRDGPKRIMMPQRLRCWWRRDKPRCSTGKRCSAHTDII
jgi:hypothetical protein